MASCFLLVVCTHPPFSYASFSFCSSRLMRSALVVQPRSVAIKRWILSVILHFAFRFFLFLRFLFLFWSAHPGLGPPLGRGSLDRDIAVVTVCASSLCFDGFPLIGFTSGAAPQPPKLFSSLLSRHVPSAVVTHKGGPLPFSSFFLVCFLHHG
eukprot:RCo046887